MLKLFVKYAAVDDDDGGGGGTGGLTEALVVIRWSLIIAGGFWCGW